MKLFGRELSTFAKALLVMVAVLLVSAGMCGLQTTFDSSLPNNSHDFFFVLGLAELAAMIFSAVGIVLMLLALGVRALIRLGTQDTSKDESLPKHDEKQ